MRKAQISRTFHKVAETVTRATRFEIEGLTAPGDFAKIPMASPHRYGLGYQLTRAAAPVKAAVSPGPPAPASGGRAAAASVR